MKKRELRQLYWLKGEIEVISERVQQLEAALAGGVSKLDGLPTAPGITDKVGEFVPEIMRMKADGEEKLRKAVAELERLHNYIDDIEDSLLRQIFTLRYVKGLSWVQVAHRVGGNTADSCRMMHNRYLQRNF